MLVPKTSNSRRFCKRSISLQLWVAYAMGILLLPCSSSLSCVRPCPDRCPSINCEYRYRDDCQCCEFCGGGPGDYCEGLLHGKCGEGLHCVRNLTGLNDVQRKQVTGICSHNESTTATLEPTTATSDSMAATSESRAATLVSTTVTPTPVCSPQCSVEFCHSSGKNQVCSAKGVAFERSESRNSCQHTSCRACSLIVRPNCGNTRCGEPPTKDCLRTYFQCIRRYYNSPTILQVHTEEATQEQGRILCHVPDLL